MAPVWLPLLPSLQPLHQMLRPGRNLGLGMHLGHRPPSAPPGSSLSSTQLVPGQHQASLPARQGAQPHTMVVSSLCTAVLVDMDRVAKSRPVTVLGGGVPCGGLGKEHGRLHVGHSALGSLSLGFNRLRGLPAARVAGARRKQRPAEDGHPVPGSPAMPPLSQCPATASAHGGREQCDARGLP